MREKIIDNIKNLSLFLFSICLFILSAEIGLRRIDFPKEPNSGWRWSNSPYKSEANIADMRVNELGLRGRSISYKDSDFVIVLLGDSYTEAGTHSFEDMPEQILEKLLREEYHHDNIRVFSVASAGWGQDQQFIWLINYFTRFRADLVLMWLTPINDYWENGNIDRSITQKAGPLKPTFAMSGNGLHLAYPQSHMKIRLLTEQAIARIQYGREGGLEQLYTSRWLRSLPESKLSPVSPATCPQTEVDQFDFVSAYEKGAPLTVITDEDLAEGRSHFSHFLSPRSPRETYQINLTHRLINETKSFAETHGASFRAFYPKASDLDKALALVKCVKEKASGNYYKSDFSDLTSDISNSDLRDALLPVTLHSARPTLISSRDWHLNREGNLLAMDALAQQLIDHNLLDRHR